MKKSLLVLFSIFTATAAYSQAPKGFSIAAGGNVSFLNVDNFNTKSKSGFLAGVSYAFGESESFNYQADLLFNHGGFDIGYRNETSYYTDQIIRNSVDLLLHFNYYVLKPQEGKFNAGIQAGVYASYGKWDAEYENEWPLSRQFNYDDATQFNYGISPGIVLGYDDFKLSVKYNMGLNDAMHGLYEDYDYNAKLNTLTLTAYYRLF